MDIFGLAYNTYRRKNGQFGKKPGRPRNPSVHGNARTSTKPAVLYAQFDDEGTFQKWGITQETGNPRSRYHGKDKLPDDWEVVEMIKGKRSDMLDLERELSEKRPGPRNKESWAGDKEGEALSTKGTEMENKKQAYSKKMQSH